MSSTQSVAGPLTSPFHLPPVPFLKSRKFQSDLKRLQDEGFESARSAVILGSGWGKVTEEFETLASVGYRELESVGAPTVEGHAGVVRLIKAGDASTLVWVGRRHLYEKAKMMSVVAPIVLSRLLGADRVLLTNAAGSVNRYFEPGDLMVLDDHLNQLGRTPLKGVAAFLPMNPCYDVELSRALKRSAGRKEILYRTGVYCATCGPEYETPAEVAKFAALGASAVGMSTVPEALMARYFGMRVVGLSCITNVAAGLGLTHAEVQAVLAEKRPSFSALFSDFLPALNAT